MLILFLFGIQVLFGILVIYLIICLIVHRRKLTTKTQPDPISIVIPFRNEAQNLPGLLQSLAEQKYQGLFEILLVNF